MSTAARYPDWQLRFEAFVRERRAMPFAWSRNDCATFAADAVLALTGSDLVPPGWRGVHTCAPAALRAVRAAGGLPALAAAALGEPVPVLMAGVGDVLLVPMGRHVALGICNGHTVLGPGRSGLVALPMAGALTCWRVG